MIDNGQVKNQSDLAHKLGIFTVSIHQILIKETISKNLVIF
jgi:hypothetical protein